MDLTSTFLIAVVVVIAIVFYQKKLSARAVLNKAKEEAVDSINTDEEIYSRMIMCILLNGKEFDSHESVENDLKKKSQVLQELEKKGMGDELYKSLNDIEQKYISLSMDMIWDCSQNMLLLKH